MPFVNKSPNEVKASKPYHYKSRYFDYGNSNIWLGSSYDNFYQGRSTSQRELIKEKVVQGYSSQCLPFQILINANTAQNSQQAYEAVLKKFKRLLPEFTNRLANGQQPEPLLQQFNQKINQYLTENNLDDAVDVSIAVTYQHKDELRCVGFSQGHTNFVCRRNDSGKVTGFDGCNADLTAGSFYFSQQVECDDEIVVYTQLDAELFEQPTSDSEKQLAFERVQQGVSLFDYLLTENQRLVAARRAQAAITNQTVEFGGDCSIASMIVPNKNLQQIIRFKHMRRGCLHTEVLAAVNRIFVAVNELYSNGCDSEKDHAGEICRLTCDLLLSGQDESREQVLTAVKTKASELKSGYASRLRKAGAALMILGGIIAFSAFTLAFACPPLIFVSYGIAAAGVGFFAAGMGLNTRRHSIKDEAGQAMNRLATRVEIIDTVKHDHDGYHLVPSSPKR